MECLLGALVCAVDEEEFDSGLLDSLVVPFAETELHGPLTRLMTCNMTHHQGKLLQEWNWPIFSTLDGQ